MTLDLLDLVPRRGCLRITGADLLAHHPGAIYRSLRSNALGLPDGYNGPGTLTPVTNWTELHR